MLEAIGLGSAEELFDSIPQDLRLQRPLNTPAALSEIELLDTFEQMGARNAGAGRISFLGGGAYSHYTPTIVDHILSRSEFFTAYTPYQPEISQGTLQTIFEFQTLVCQLTGMEVANASMYDGSTGTRGSRVDGGTCDETVEGCRIDCCTSRVSRSSQNLRSARGHSSRAR